MALVRKVDRCRLSGEPLSDAVELFSIRRCPFPGLYPGKPAASAAMRVPMSVVQSRGSRLVQLAHRVDPAIYKSYAFAGAVSRGYSAYQRELAARIARSFPRSASVLEIGCGDGFLLQCLKEAGFRHLHGIEPSRQAKRDKGRIVIARGFFPVDMPADWRGRKFDLVLARQVVEHLDDPVSFVRNLAGFVLPGGQAWIEVPDLKSTLQFGLFSNFYPIHVTYFTSKTLDALMRCAGMVPDFTEIVDVFGGSILAGYRHGAAVPAGRAPDPLFDIRQPLAKFKKRIVSAASGMPAGTVGYGAAERTSAIIGLCPELEKAVSCLYDANPAVQGRCLGGTRLAIRCPSELLKRNPPGVVLFAVSHRKEILAKLAGYLAGETAIMIADNSAAVGPLHRMARGACE